MPSSFRDCACLSVPLLAALLGCSSSPSGPAGTDQGAFENLTIISNAYREANTKLKRPPKSRDELVEFLPKDKNVDDLFQSSNDGKPFVIIWNVVMDPTKIGIGEPAVIAFEQEGKDGYRFVANVFGIETMDEATFAKANIPADKRP